MFVLTIEMVHPDWHALPLAGRTQVWLLSLAYQRAQFDIQASATVARSELNLKGVPVTEPSVWVRARLQVQSGDIIESRFQVKSDFFTSLLQSSRRDALDLLKPTLQQVLC